MHVMATGKGLLRILKGYNVPCSRFRSSRQSSGYIQHRIQVGPETIQPLAIPHLMPMSMAVCMNVLVLMPLWPSSTWPVLLKRNCTPLRMCRSHIVRSGKAGSYLPMPSYVLIRRYHPHTC